MALWLGVSFMKLTFPILSFSLSILIFLCGCEKSTGPKKDTTPPAAITDLRIVADTETPVTLAWSAPGDDGNKGAAVLYSIRYSTETAVLYEWHFATQVFDEPAPHPAGTVEEFVVTGLSPDSNYYFAIKAQDDAGNWSPLSNIASSVPVAAGGIAFVSDRDDNLEIYVVSSDGANLKNITQNEADDWDPAWSWDRRIAFVSDRGGGESDIWISSADGRYQGQLTSRKNWQCYRPVFSRNGYTIAFYGRHYRPWKNRRILMSDIYIVNSDGTNLRNLTENLDLYSSYVPAWSPDGRRIAFASGFDWCPFRDIYVINIDGSRPRKLSYSDEDPDFFPIWSPDGSRILYVSDCHSEIGKDPGPYPLEVYCALYVMNSDGSDPRILAGAVFAIWSPDGTKIAFEARGDIWVMNSDGSDKRQLTTHPAYDGEPTWSPDGTKIAFLSLRDGNEEIYVMNADGTGQRNLSNHPGRDFNPAWSDIPTVHWISL